MKLSLFLSLVALLPAVHLPADVITTVAGDGGSELRGFSGKALEFSINQPFGVEFDSGGRLHICEVGNHRVLRLDSKTGRIVTVAGNGKKGYSGDGGPATDASLNEPYELRFDGDDNLYFVEMRGCVVRRVDRKTGVISTVAGTGEPGYSGDGGAAVKAALRSPHSIALDGRGELYIADIGNHRIRRVDLESGTIETVAGTGERQLPVDGSVARGKAMLGPRALHITGRTLWIALREGHSVWSMDLETSRLRHLAGTGEKGYLDGPAGKARFNGPKGIVAADNGELYVVDTENQAIRRVDPGTRTVTTVAGYGPAGNGFAGDGGDAAKAKMGRPHGIAIGPRGGIYIGDTNNHRVRRVRRASQASQKE